MLPRFPSIFPWVPIGTPFQLLTDNSQAYQRRHARERSGLDGDDVVIVQPPVPTTQTRKTWSDARKHAMREDIIQHRGMGVRILALRVRPQLPQRHWQSGDIELDGQVLRGDEIRIVFVPRSSRLHYLNPRCPHIY